MLKLYKYAFYIFYSWSYKLHRNEESHHITAFFSLTFLVYINILSALLILNIAFNLSEYKLSVSKIEIALCFLLTVVPQYYLILYKRKYLKILEEFAVESPKKLRRRKIAIWVYIIISFLLLFSVVLFKMRLNQGLVL